MKRAALLTLTALLAVACQDQRVVSPAIDGPNFLIQDGANNGNPDFWFLPPVVGNPQGDPEFEPNEFNPNLMPVVEICMGGPGCGNEFPASLNGNHYHFNWKSSRSDAGTYRVTVLASTGGFELGFFDAEVSSKGKSATPGNIAVKAGSNVPVKFSVENAALCYDPTTGQITRPCASATFDLSQDNTLQLADPTGTLISQVDVPAQPSQQVTTFTMQFCEDLNPRVVDLPSFGDCIKILPDPQLENQLVDPALVSVCEFLPGGTTGLSEDQEDRVTLHQAAEDESQVTALPDAPSNCAQQVGQRSTNPIIRLAQRVRDRVVGWVAPTPLWANIMVLDRGGGGATSNFESDFQYLLPAIQNYVNPLDANRTAEPGTGLPVRVIVKDTGGDPVAGATVHFAVTQGGGSLDALSDITGLDGIAEVLLTIAEGPNKVVASARGIADPQDGDVFAPDHTLPPEQQQVVILGQGTLEFLATGEVAEPQPVLYGVNSNDDGLSTIDPANGNVNFIGPLNASPNIFVTPIAMAVRPSDQKLFVWNNSNIVEGEPDNTGVLLTVNVCTGVGTPVDAETPGQGQLSALAFSPDGALYGTDTKLFSVNTATGVRNEIGNLGMGLRVAAADFDGEGTLWGVELTGIGTTERLVTIHLGTGAASVVATLSQDIGIIGSIVFAPDGTLIGSGSGTGAGDILFDINTQTGAVSNIRALNGGTIPQGMGFAPACDD